MVGPDAIISQHALSRMLRKGIRLTDVEMVLSLGEHGEGRRPGIREACAELDGRPITIVYDAGEYLAKDVYRIVAVLRRRCSD